MEGWKSFVRPGQEQGVENKGASPPHDLVSQMERQELEEEAEAVALNGGVEPGSMPDYKQDEVSILQV